MPLITLSNACCCGRGRGHGHGVRGDRVMIVIVLPTAMLPAEIDDDCGLTVEMAVPPMAASPHHGAASVCLYSGAGDCIVDALLKRSISIGASSIRI